MVKKQAVDALNGESVDGRAQHLLKRLVEGYIADGQPVASKRLAAQSGLDVSAATVRNIMGELQERGLVRSPHTSAGKIPTNLGLRFFVDTLLSVEPLDTARVAQVKAELNPDLAPNELVQSASELLSDLTQMACVVMLPRRDDVALRHVEFLPLSGKRALVILVMGDREVQNRVLHLEREFTEAELTYASNFINHEFAGLSLTDLRQRLLESMQADKDRMDQIMQTALDLASQTFAEEEADSSSEMVVAGRSSLLDTGGDSDQVRLLFDAFSRKGSILHLLDGCLQTDGVQLFIGEEAGYQFFDDMSLVTSPYEVNGKVAGVLGVVGPTRMAYSQVIPVVDVTAQVLGEAISYT